MAKKKASGNSDLDDRLQQLYQYTQAIAATGATYTELWNAVFGTGARYGQLFPDRDERKAIEKSSTMAKIKSLLAKAPRATEESDLKTGKLLLRIPKTLHQALADEADAEGVSLNQLILTKLALTLGQAVSR